MFMSLPAGMAGVRTCRGKHLLVIGQLNLHISPPSQRDLPNGHGMRDAAKRLRNPPVGRAGGWTRKRRASPQKSGRARQRPTQLSRYPLPQSALRAARTGPADSAGSTAKQSPLDCAACSYVRALCAPQHSAPPDRYEWQASTLTESIARTQRSTSPQKHVDRGVSSA